MHLSKPSTLFALSLEKACGEGEGRKGHDVIITVTFSNTYWNVHNAVVVIVIGIYIHNSEILQ